MSESLKELADRVVRSARSRGRCVATVESCTAGALACVLAEGEGASEVLHGGFVVYTKTAKSATVGVPPDLLDKHSAVSREVALAMARRDPGTRRSTGGPWPNQWSGVFTVIACDVCSLKAFRSSSAKKGLISTETPCEVIETAVCDLMSPVITMAGTSRPRTARR